MTGLASDVGETDVVRSSGRQRLDRVPVAPAFTGTPTGGGECRGRRPRR